MTEYYCEIQIENQRFRYITDSFLSYFPGHQNRCGIPDIFFAEKLKFESFQSIVICCNCGMNIFFCSGHCWQGRLGLGAAQVQIHCITVDNKPVGGG